MFGTLRFVFAFMVVVTKYAGIEVIAGIGVWGFFMLSGFLMTLVLNKKYTFTRKGIGLFFISRVLRLYPCYFAVVAITMVLYYRVLGMDFSSICDHYFSTIRDITANVFILSNTIFGIGRANVVVPISWAVDVELMMYFASVVFIARNPKFSLYSMLFTTALFPLLWLISKQYIADDPQTASNLIYSFLPAALLPYTIGSFLCHYRKKIILQFSPVRLALVSAVLLLIIFQMPKFSVTLTYLVSLPLLAGIIVMLFRVKRNPVDSFLGDLTYPMYLSIGTLNTLLIQTDFCGYPRFIADEKSYTPFGFAIAFAALLSISLLLYLCIDRPMNTLRQKLTLS